MSTASTQFEDERRLYENIRKQHRDALRREQVRLARGHQPGGASALLASARHMLTRSRHAMRVASAPDGHRPSVNPAEVMSNH